MTRRRLMGAALAALLLSSVRVRGDETCMSPYMPKITGQEDYVYVLTLGIEGVGDGSDKLVTIGGNPADPARYGKVISTARSGGPSIARSVTIDSRPAAMKIRSGCTTELGARMTSMGAQ